MLQDQHICTADLGRGVTFPFLILPQAEEIVMLSSLAREAAELLWEMVATEDIGDAMQQMRENATTIQVLRRHRWQSGPAVCTPEFGHASESFSFLHTTTPASPYCRASCVHHEAADAAAEPMTRGVQALHGGQHHLRLISLHQTDMSGVSAPPAGTAAGPDRRLLGSG